MPSRYIELIWSTATFKPSNSKIWSVSLVAFSNAMWYWNPEQPPPTTATRSAVGTGVCIPMISLTLVLAVGVRLIIFLGLRRGKFRGLLTNQVYQNRNYSASFVVKLSVVSRKPLLASCFDKPNCFPYN